MADEALTVEEIAVLLGRDPAELGPPVASLELAAEVLDQVAAILEQSARRFSVALAGQVRRAAHVRLVGLEMRSQPIALHGHDFCRLLLPPAGEQPWLVELGGDVLSPIIDCLLGGDGKSSVPLNRPPTDIEQRLLERVLRPLVDAFNQDWQIAAPASYELAPVPRVPLHTAPLPRLQAGFTVEVAQQRGHLRLSIAAAAIPSLPASTAPVDASADEPLPPAIPDHAELVACLEETPLGDEELSELKPGDILTTDHPADRPILLIHNGQARFSAQLGALHGKKAVRLQALLDAAPADTPPSPDEAT